MSSSTLLRVHQTLTLSRFVALGFLYSQFIYTTYFPITEKGRARACRQVQSVISPSMLVFGLAVVLLSGGDTKWEDLYWPGETTSYYPFIRLREKSFFTICLQHSNMMHPSLHMSLCCLVIKYYVQTDMPVFSAPFRFRNEHDTQFHHDARLICDDEHGLVYQVAPHGSFDF